MEANLSNNTRPKEPLVVAIAGPTAAGKSTLVQSLKDRYADNVPVFGLSLDDFYIDNDLIEMTGKWKNWDIPSSFNLVDLAKAVEEAKEKARAVEPIGLILVEGIVLFSHPTLLGHFNAIVFLDLPEERFKERRFQRDTWIQKNEEYFEDVVLPAYYQHGLAPQLENCRMKKVDATLPMNVVLQEVFAQLEEWRDEA